MKKKRHGFGLATPNFSENVFGHTPEYADEKKWGWKEWVEFIAVLAIICAVGWAFLH